MVLVKCMRVFSSSFDGVLTGLWLGLRFLLVSLGRIEFLVGLLVGSSLLSMRTFTFVSGWTPSTREDSLSVMFKNSSQSVTKAS